MGNIILGSDGIAIRQGIYQEKADKMTDLGRFVEFQDGRRFRYCKCNASAGITRGHMCSAAALNGDTDKVTQTAMTVALSNGYIGEKVINVLLSDDVAAHLFDDGLLTIEDGTGAGYCYRIKSNKAGGAVYTAPCELTLYDPIVVALAADAVISLTVNKYKNVVVTPQTETAPPIGVPLIDVTEAYYFWAQTRGYAALYIGTGETAPVGDNVGISADEDGACDVAAAAPEKAWGVSIQPAAADTYATIDLMLE